MAAASGAGILALGVLGLAAWLSLGREARPPDAGSPSAGAPAPAQTAAVPAPQPAAAVPAPRPAAPARPPPTAAALAAALRDIPCSALAASMRADTVEVDGFVSKTAGPGRVKEALSALPGVAGVSLAVRQVDPASCPVISALAPYWTASRQAGAGAGGRLRLAGAAAGADAVLAEGDSLMVDITSPNAASFVTVDAYLADGKVIHLLPNALALDNRVPPNHAETIGRPGDWIIGRSPGAELVVVLLTTPTPLFGTLRRESEPRTDYLADLAANLEQVRARNGPGKIGVEFLPIAIRTPQR
jgi:hypothetical protein